jgi:hypothetical protein
MIRAARSRSGCPCRSAISCSVMMMPASLRGAHWTRESHRLVARRVGDDGEPAARACRTAQEVRRATHRAQMWPAGYLGVDLPREIHFEGRVDRHQLLLGGQDLGMMRVAGLMQLDGQIAMRIGEQPPRSVEKPADGPALVQGLARVVIAPAWIRTATLSVSSPSLEGGLE